MELKSCQNDGVNVSGKAFQGFLFSFYWGDFEADRVAETLEGWQSSNPQPFWYRANHKTFFGTNLLQPLILTPKPTHSRLLSTWHLPCPNDQRNVLDSISRIRFKYCGVKMFEPQFFHWMWFCGFGRSKSGKTQASRHPRLHRSISLVQG